MCSFLLHLEIKGAGLTLYSAISHLNTYFNGIICGNKYVFPAEVTICFYFVNPYYFSTRLPLPFSIISICVCKNVIFFLCLYVLFTKLLVSLAFGLKTVLQYDYDSLICMLMSIFTIETKIVGSKYSWFVLSMGSERQNRDGFELPVHEHD